MEWREEMITIDKKKEDRNGLECISSEMNSSNVPFVDNLINSLYRNKRLKKRKKIREDLKGFFESVDLPEIQVDYRKYEQPHNSKHLIVDDLANIYVDRDYLSYLKQLAEDIETKSINVREQTKFSRRRAADGHYKTPHIVGLWQDIEDDRWPIYGGERKDTEQEYFSKSTHSLTDYIDDEWDAQEKRRVYIYLHTRKIIVDSIIINRSFLKKSGCYDICTDGTYLWHESLEDFVRLYSVRPPKFFVDHILYSGQEESIN